MPFKHSVGRRASAVKQWIRRVPARVGRRVQTAFKSEKPEGLYRLQDHDGFRNPIYPTEFLYPNEIPSTFRVRQQPVNDFESFEGFHHPEPTSNPTSTSSPELARPENTDGFYRPPPRFLAPLPRSPAYGCLPLLEQDDEDDEDDERLLELVSDDEDEPLLQGSDVSTLEDEDELSSSEDEDEPLSSRDDSDFIVHTPDEVEVDGTRFIMMRIKTPPASSSTSSSVTEYSNKSQGFAPRLRRVTSRIADAATARNMSPENPDIDDSDSTETPRLLQYCRERRNGIKKHGPRESAGLPNTDWIQWPTEEEIQARVRLLDAIEELDESDEAIQDFFHDAAEEPEENENEKKKEKEKATSGGKKSPTNSFHDSGIDVENEEEKQKRIERDAEHYIAYSFEEATFDEDVREAMIEQARLYPAYHLLRARRVQEEWLAELKEEKRKKKEKKAKKAKKNKGKTKKWAGQTAKQAVRCRARLVNICRRQSSSSLKEITTIEE